MPQRITAVAGKRRAARLGGGLLCIALCLLLTNCAGGTQLRETAAPTPSAQRITAEKLRGLPGRELGAFRFHLLDEHGLPVNSWDGIEVRSVAVPDSAEFSLQVTSAAPQALYLYVVYDAQQWSAESVELSSQFSRREDFLLLAIPRRVTDLLIVGAVRLGDPARAVPEGELLRLRFRPGNDRALRGSSLVNQDPASAPFLIIDPPDLPGANATLYWEERNIGDYNNNGMVEIADLAPIGRLYKQRTMTASDVLEFELVDGDANGEINASDLLPIARNYQRSIEGYSLFHAPGSDPGEAEFVPLADPALSRATVVLATPASKLRQRLEYSFSFSPELGLHNYRVQAWTNEAGSYAYGPPSNRVSLDGQPLNAPPLWETTSGLTDAAGITGGLRLHFGRALDPEGGPVSYVLRYKAGSGALTGPGVIEAPIPAAAISGNPPYSHDLLGLASGTAYTLLLLAEDQVGLRTSNSSTLLRTVPGLAAPTDPWCCIDGNPARTGSNPASTVSEPLVLDWSQPIGNNTYCAGPFVRSSGQAVIQVPLGLAQFDVETGSGGVAVLGGSLVDWTETGPALSGTRFLSSTQLPGELGLFDLVSLSHSTLPFAANGQFAHRWLSMGDYAYSLDQAGALHCILLPEGQVAWKKPAVTGGSRGVLPCSDGSALYVGYDDGSLFKYRLLDGQQLASGSFQLPAFGGSTGLVCNVTDALLYSEFAAYHAGDLSLAWSIPGTNLTTTGPLLAQHFPTPLLVSVGADQLAATVTLSACNPATGEVAWSSVIPGCLNPAQLVASASRIFLLGMKLSVAGYVVFVVDPADGAVLQELQLGQGAYGELVPAGDRLLCTIGNASNIKLTALRPDTTLEISWPGSPGIKSVQPVGGEAVRVFWDEATAPAGLQVRYSLFMTELPAPLPGRPPVFDPPFTDTTVLSSLSAAEGTTGYLISGLTAGRRYSFAVRAYYGPWGENALTDGNTKWLACTAGWMEQAPLDLGAAPPPGGTQLPPGRVHLLKGVLDDNSKPHLVYNDEASTKLTHVFQDAGGDWQIEATGLNNFIAVDFDLNWTGSQLHIAYAAGGMGEKVGILSRTAADTWNDTPFASLTTANPQVSLALADPPPPAGQGVLAYTQFISGSLPTPRGEYNLVRTDGLGNWIASATLDPDNFCGRDLAAVLDPATLQPWIALQRGYFYASNRLTPQNGELFLARSDGLGGYDFTLVDAGANPQSNADDEDSSDVGKRVQLQLDSSGLPHLAYLDLNAAPLDPLGQLRYAGFDGSSWRIQTLLTMDLSYQTFHSLQYTYGELCLALTPPGSPGGADRPVIAFLARQTASSTANDPHLAIPAVFVADAAGKWQREQLEEAINVYPNDREPCVLLVNVAEWQFYCASTRADSNAGAQRIRWWKRQL